MVKKRVIWPILVCVLTASGLAAGQTASPAQGTSPPTPPETSAQAPAQPSAAPAKPSAEPPAEVPHLAPGTPFHLVIVEPVHSTALAEVPIRTSTVGIYEKVTKEFEKQKRFRLVDVDESEMVFFVLRYWKAGGFHTETFAALAVPTAVYKKNVEWLNGFRGTARVEAMLAAAYWSSNKNYDMTKRWVVGLATANLVNAGRANPADLVKDFHRDMP
jgi:hypothetical protein